MEDKRIAGTDYTLQLGRVPKSKWDSIVQGFSDRNIYQTWAWGAGQWGEKQISHAILYNNGQVMAAAQLKVKTLPFLDVGVASILWGPMWQPLRRTGELDSLRHLIRCLIREYAERRKLLLRVAPNARYDRNGDVQSMLLGEGFKRCTCPRTLILDLSPPLEELRKSFKRQWCQHLNQAEKSGLEIREGVDEDLLNTVGILYSRMVSRKKFTPDYSLKAYKAIQKELWTSAKLKIMLAEHEGQPVACLLVSYLGDTAVALIAATDIGRPKLYGSYLLWWRMMERLKESGCEWFDLCGIDPVRNPGGYQFKMGLGKKWGKEVYYPKFEICHNSVSKATSILNNSWRHAYENLRPFCGTAGRRP